jgi:hypothetical protein
MSAASRIQNTYSHFVQCVASCCLFICGRGAVSSAFGRHYAAASGAMPRVWIVLRRRPRGCACGRMFYNCVVQNCGIVYEGEKFGGRAGRTSRPCFESVSTKVAKNMKNVKMCQVAEFQARDRCATSRRFQPWCFGGADRRSACVVTRNVWPKMAFWRHVRAPCECYRTKWRKATAPGTNPYPRAPRIQVLRVRLQ